MATNNTSITLSGQEAERLRQTIQDAHDHIQSAQRDIYRAQGCLNEVHNLLSLRSVNNTAPRLASPNSTIKAAPKAPTVKAKEQKVQNKDGTQEANEVASHLDSAEAEDSSNITDYAQTSESTKPRRKARWSTDAMTDTENAFLRTQIGYPSTSSSTVRLIWPTGSNWVAGAKGMSDCVLVEVVYSSWITVGIAGCVSSDDDSV